MKKEDAIHILTAMKKSYMALGIPDPEAVDALEMAINAVKAEPCEDCISRRKAIISITAHSGMSEQIEALEKLPVSICQTHKTGHWERVEKEEKYCVEYWYECSECHGKPLKEWGADCLSNYCPHCGAKMEEPE